MNRTTSVAALAVAIAAGAGLARCGKDDAEPEPVHRANSCEVDLAPWLSNVGNSATAKKVTEPAQLIGGESAWGRVGDYVLANDRIRAVIQAPDRHIQPNPWGGQLIDADLVRADGSGRDRFGKLGLLYNFGRTQEATDVSVLESGEGGGSAVLVADGKDALNDFFNVNSALSGALPGTTLTVNPETELPLTISNYYILNPGESRVRIVSAFCNAGDKPLNLPVGDLIDSGGPVEFFQPTSCTGGFGYSYAVSCMIGDMPWYGFLGDGVAYGYAPYQPASPTTPSLRNGALVVAGVVGTLLGIPDSKTAMEFVLDYTDPNSTNRGGQLKVPAGGSNVLVRDFVVGRDLGEVASLIATYRNASLQLPMGDLEGTVSSGGKPLAGARVALERDVATTTGGTQHVLEAVFTTDENGAFQGRLPAAEYQISAWAPGTAPTALEAARVEANGTLTKSFTLEPPRTVTVEIRDLQGSPIPGKLTLLCESHPCSVAWSKLVKYTDVVRDQLPDNVAAIDYVGPTGTATVKVPAGKYRAVVSRGPEWSVFPTTWNPIDSTDASTGLEVDVTAADAKVTAVLARVLDTAGWVSADFHVHAVNSPDAYVPNRERLISFMGEGVDVLVATDHDYVTDFGPLNRQLGGDKFLSTVAGEEITTFDYGHTNAWPLTRDENDLVGGAIDWAGGPGPSLSQPEIVRAAKARGATTVQLNHPRGNLGVFTAMKLDTDSGATHADPKQYRIAPQPGATESDAKLFSFEFDAMEVLNGGLENPSSSRALFNDWFSFLSRGELVAATGVSDTHQRFVSAPGYWRSWVNAGFDAPVDFDAAKLSEAVNKLRLVPTNGPFVKLTAHKIDASGAQVGTDVGLGETLAASGSRFELVVDAQVPAWMKLARIEIITHVPNGDVPCSPTFDPAKSPKSRVSCNGVGNPNWPAEGIAAAIDLAVADALVEKVAEKDGVAYERARVVKRFALDAPARDTWFVAIVYGAGTMFPLVYADVDAKTKKAGDVKPFAVTNPVFVDADGAGYDKFPGGPMTTRSKSMGGASKSVTAPPVARQRVSPAGLETVIDRFVREH